MLSSIIKSEFASNVQNYLTYTITYLNGNEPKQNDKLSAGKRLKLIVTLGFKYDLNETSIDAIENVDCSFSINYTACDKSVAVNVPHNAQMLIDNAFTVGTNYSEDTKGELFTFNHGDTEQAGVLTDYRYIGNSPNNYIDINGETWRIIGVFTVDDGTGKKEQRIKIIKDSFMAKKYSWNDHYANGESVGNEWSSSTIHTTFNVNYPGSYYYDNLSSDTKSQIGKAIYYLGDGNSLNKNAEDIYIFERSLQTKEGRSKNITSYIALMYASDYVYTYANGVNNDCFNDSYNCSSTNAVKSWLYSKEDEWVLTPSGNGATLLYGGYLVRGWGVEYAAQIRPSAYLKSSVQIAGSGTKSDHYKVVSW